MKNLLKVATLSLVTSLAVGCTSQQYQEETTARLTAAEKAAATAQARADEAHSKAEEAMVAAQRAQQNAQEANARAMRIIESSRSR
jgi:hypothetical protein|tara:strand:+ start:70733 stop:70990 length:258 start_codon:yes stop_codon:yes gene_type:complete